MPINMVQLINTTDRSAVSELLKLEQYVDVIIQGRKSLIKKYPLSQKFRH